jgi:hypothetical protein
VSAIDDNERTSALGLFNTARSYWRSAEHLNSANLKVTHPQAPITFLFCHAIELYLKAYLRGAEKSVAELKQIGHRVASLAKAAVNTDLKIGPEQSEVLSHIDDDAVAMEARYIVTGFKNLPTNEALSGVASCLNQSVCAALAKKGFAVRAEIFERLEPQRDTILKADTTLVLVHMFKHPDRESCEVEFMSLVLELERSVLQYHLDRLRDLEFARLASSMDNQVYWRLTAEGRAHVVENKLI